MCDNDKNGSVDKKELSELLQSLVDIAKTKKLSENNVNDLISHMFMSAGFEDKEELSYEDFKAMMKEFKGDLLAIGLDCKGAKQNYLDATTNVARYVVENWLSKGYHENNHPLLDLLQKTF